ALAGVPADAEIQNGSAAQRHDGSDSRNRKTEARFLIVNLRIGFLVCCGVGHADRRAIEHVNASPFPQPSLIGFGVQRSTNRASYVGEELFGQSFARLTISSRLCRAWLFSPREQVGNETGDGCAAGVVRAQHLAQKNPEGDKGRIDSVFPECADRRERPCNEVFRENIGERQIAVLQKLASQKLYLVPKPSLVRMAHLGPPCR